MIRYKMNATFIDDMGSISAIDVTDSFGESKEEQALWHINSMRRHDGLPELEELPDHITFSCYYNKEEE